MQWFKHLRLDFWLLLFIFATCAFGLTVLYSAGGESRVLVTNQIIRLCIGVLVMLFIAQVDLRLLRTVAPLLYVPGLILLIAVLFFGVVGKGAQRWLDVFAFRFQPSEFMRIIVPVIVAWRLADVSYPPPFRVTIEAMLLILIPCALIILQPDLGTALLIAAAGFLTLFIAGLHKRIIFGGIAMLIVSAPFIWLYGLHDYQQKRILTFFHPERDPLGAGYHIIQSKIAIGSGGVSGKGFLNGTQSQLEFLPERTTDFIFAVLAEEFGYLGVLTLLMLYLLIIVRCIYLVNRTQDHFSFLLGSAITLTFCIYVIVNIGMVSGLLPVVGLPLPFMSYGGTSMVIIMIGFGLIMAMRPTDGRQLRRRI